MKAEQRSKAYALFLKSKTHRQIVEELSVSKATVCRWSLADKWVKCRENARIQAIQEIYQDSATVNTAKLNEKSNRVELLLRQALAEQEAFQRGLISRKQCKFNLKDILQFVKILTQLDSTQKAVGG